MREVLAIGQNYCVWLSEFVCWEEEERLRVRGREERWGVRVERQRIMNEGKGVVEGGLGWSCAVAGLETTQTVY